jgi:hypothetical protein
MKRPSELAPSREERRQQRLLATQQEQSDNGPSTNNDLSRLEQLPVELIQHIFFCCLETNLPNTSLTINRALSDEAIFRAIILFAYFEHRPHLPVEEALFKPASFHHVSFQDRCRLQIGMWKCRWCNIDRVKAAMPALSRLVMVQRWHEEYTWNVQHDVTSETSGNVPNPGMAPIASLPALTDHKAMEEHFLARLDFSYCGGLFRPFGDFMFAEQPCGYDQYLPFVTYWCSKVDGEGKIYKTLDGTDTTIGVRHIPPGMLRKAAQLENYAALRLLRQGMRFVREGHILDISADALFDGMHDALTVHQADSLLTLLALVELWSHVFGPRWRNRERIPALHPIPLRIFHAAIRHQKHHFGCTLMLLRADLGSVPPDDPVITSWALKMEAKGANIGRWLLDHMTSAGRDGQRELLFNNGALSWRRPEGSYPFDESSFTEDMGYITQRAVNAYPTSPDGGPPG